MPRSARIPSYRLHRASGCAVVTLNGKDVYLGTHGSPESRAAYQRAVAEWLVRHETTTEALGGDGDELSLAEVMLAYLKHAATYYRDADGQPALMAIVGEDGPCFFLGEMIWSAG